MHLTFRIHFRNLRGDGFGGVTAAVIALPMALAFGVASGAGAASGLWGAVLVGFFAALFGGTPTLISEPTGPMTVIMTAVLTTMIGRYGDDGVAIAFTVVMMAGIFQVLLGSLKLGKYITLMPYSVVSGFMSGIGVILILLQVAPFLGHPIPDGGVMGTLREIPNLVQNIQGTELMLGLATLAILFFMPKKWRKFVPAQLVALVAITLVSIFFLNGADIRRIGVIPTGLPSITVPNFSPNIWTTMVLDAMVLGMLGCVDTLLTAVIGDSLTRKEHKSDRELVGAGNCEFFQWSVRRAARRGCHDGDGCQYSGGFEIARCGCDPRADSADCRAGRGEADRADSAGGAGGDGLPAAILGLNANFLSNDF